MPEQELVVLRLKWESCLDWYLVLMSLGTLIILLQLASLTAAEGQKLANLTCKTLERIHNDEYFDMTLGKNLLF